MGNGSIAVVLGFGAQHAEVKKEEDVGEDLPPLKADCGWDGERDRERKESSGVNSNRERANVEKSAEVTVGHERPMPERFPRVLPGVHLLFYRREGDIVRKRFDEVCRQRLAHPMSVSLGRLGAVPSLLLQQVERRACCAGYTRNSLCKGNLARLHA